MKIGILIASESFEVFSGARRIEEAAQEMGHESVKLFERKISFEEIDGKLTVKYEGKPMPELDAIIVRPNFVEEPTLHQYIYDLLSRAGYKVINGSMGITRTKNKLLQRADLRAAGVPMPKWAAAYDVIGCEAAVKGLGYPVMLKMAFGTKGKGVFFADKRETMIPIIDYLSVRDGNPVIIEEFIEEAKHSHVRIFVIGGEVVAAMLAIAPQDEVRSNAGGTYEAIELTDEERRIAVICAETMNLAIAGVDLLRSSRGPLVMEVNANPGFSELEKTTGINIAQKIVEYALRQEGI
jgi:ribosomal protein S6--L-glutamate ligase